MTAKSRNRPGVPHWWLNTYFLFGFVMVVIAILGFVRGPRYVTDPGQPFTEALPWYYLLAAVLFFINGYISHQATVRAFRRSLSEENDA